MKKTKLLQIHVNKKKGNEIKKIKKILDLKLSDQDPIELTKPATAIKICVIVQQIEM